MIYFLVKAGLCNRMRGISSVYQFARRTKQPLTIIWPNNHECNCPFEKLFTLKGDMPVRFITISYLRNFRLRRWKERVLTALIRKKCQEQFIDDEVYEDKEILTERSCKAKNTFITSAAYWYVSENPFEIFEPVENIQESVREICRKLDGGYSVGVHLRRADHKISIEESTTEKFIDRMKEEILRNPEVKFYVASDDNKEKKRLKEIFGERIVMQEKWELSRESEQGMVGAVVDLYVLASTDKILASSESSYSETAAQIKNNQKLIVK